ncbi:MAG: LptF/LptG family permease [Phycisphaerae bacterium]|nr:LptF/LptG family permease [Phycisphaerae bacterium]
MLKTLDKYILRAFFTNYLIAIGVMIGLYVVLDLFVNLDEFTEVESDTILQTLTKIIDFYGYNLFLYFAQLAGVIILVAACFTLGRFHRTNELTAVLASGTSLYRVATPLLLAALGMNALWFIDQELIIPRIAQKLARKHADIEGRFSFEIWFQPDRDNSLVSASMFSPRTQEMRSMIVIKRDDQSRMTEVIRADRAHWDPEHADEGLWHLDNGYSMRFGSQVEAQSMDELGREPVNAYTSDLTPEELGLLQATQWTSFVSLPQLDQLQQRYAETGSTEFIKVKHKRLTTVLMNMILLCLGVPFFLNRERPSVLVAGGQCLLLCGACYVATFICQSGLDLPSLAAYPALPAWIPVLVFGPLAVVVLDGIKT